MSEPTSPPAGEISPATLALLNTAYADLATVATAQADYASQTANVQAAQVLATTALATLTSAQAQANTDALAAIAAVQADLGVTPASSAAAKPKAVSL